MRSRAQGRRRPLALRGAAEGVWHLLVRAAVRVIGGALFADEEVPDAGRQDRWQVDRRQAAPRSRPAAVAIGGGRSAIKGMPDTSGIGAPRHAEVDGLDGVKHVRAPVDRTGAFLRAMSRC